MRAITILKTCHNLKIKLLIMLIITMIIICHNVNIMLTSCVGNFIASAVTCKTYIVLVMPNIILYYV